MTICTPLLVGLVTVAFAAAMVALCLAVRADGRAALLGDEVTRLRGLLDNREVS